MTFKELKTQLDKVQPSLENYQAFEILQNKPFWIWDKDQHIREDILTKGNCCFNHIIGLPVKNGKEYPIFEYEKLIFDAIEQNQNIWVKKATGLGISEFFLRLMLWLCCRDDTYQGCQMCIVTGPNIDYATKLIRRLKNLFKRKLEPTFTDKETVLHLNPFRCEAH